MLPSRSPASPPTPGRCRRATCSSRCPAPGRTAGSSSTRRSPRVRPRRWCREASSGPRRVRVDDPLVALGRIAALVRQRSAARVVGITGSTGKTSTKDVLRALLEPHVSVVASRENQNNELGVPLTLCRTGQDTEVVVAEMAMRGSRADRLPCGDRASRRRRDHLRRPRPSGAAGHRRAGRAGEGRDPPPPGAGRRRGGARGRAAAASAPRGARRPGGRFRRRRGRRRAPRRVPPHGGRGRGGDRAPRSNVERAGELHIPSRRLEPDGGRGRLRRARPAGGRAGAWGAGT